MQDILTRLAELRRPPILLRAARHGALAYRRDRHLQRVLGYGRVPRSAEALTRLVDLEAEHEDLRTTGYGGYSSARHLDVLIALVAEADLLRARRLPEALPDLT